MVDPNKVQQKITLFTIPPNATDVLQRLRDSYSALSEGEVLTGPDQAVLAAVKITLKHLSRAGYPSVPFTPHRCIHGSAVLFRAVFAVGYHSAL